MRISLSFWWSFVVLSALAIGLASCDSPSPAFSGLAARQVTVDGSTFSVRATSYEAEAIRTNREWKASRGAIAVKGALAMQIVTGCKVRERSLQGDTNIVRAKLDCPDAAPRIDRAAPPQLDCALASGWRPDGFGGEVAEVECNVVQ